VRAELFYKAQMWQVDRYRGHRLTHTPEYLLVEMERIISYLFKIKTLVPGGTSIEDERNAVIDYSLRLVNYTALFDLGIYNFVVHIINKSVYARYSNIYEREFGRSKDCGEIGSYDVLVNLAEILKPSGK